MQFVLRLKAAKWRLCAGTLVLLLAGYVSRQYWQTDEPSAPMPPFLSQPVHDSPGVSVAQGASRQSSTNPGMEVYLDPKTGQFRKPPTKQTPGGIPTPPSSDRSEGARAHSLRKRMEEQESPVTGGGIVTDVPLRFRRPLVASRDENGKLSIQHAPGEADLDEEQ